MNPPVAASAFMRTEANALQRFNKIRCARFLRLPPEGANANRLNWGILSATVAANVASAQTRLGTRRLPLQGACPVSPV